MSERTDYNFLSDIGEAVRRTISYTERITYEEFLEDIKTQDAVIRNIEIIGEVAKEELPAIVKQIEKIATEAKPTDSVK